MEAKIYNQKGEETGAVTLPETVFNTAWNSDAVHQVVTSLASSARVPIAHAKTRGEVAGGGKKPWRQKGTGRARHGSIRSPLWVGGGVTHGPRNDKNYDRKVNKKAKAKALYAVLSRKYKDGEILFVDKFDLNEAKAKVAKTILASLGTVKGFERLASKKKNAALIALPEKDLAVERSFSNFGNIEVNEARNLNVLDALKFTYLIIADPNTSIKQLDGKLK